MSPEEIAALSLLVTILGWGVTAAYQVRLFNLQNKADKDKEIRKIKIERLEKIEKHLGHIGTVSNFFLSKILVLKESLQSDQSNVDELIEIYKSLGEHINNTLKEIIFPQSAEIANLTHMLGNGTLSSNLVKIWELLTSIQEKLYKKEGTVQDILNEHKSLKSLEIETAKEIQNMIDETFV